MVAYRRSRVPGGTYFFTVTVKNRRSSLLVDHIRSLRTAFRSVQQQRPFGIDAIVVLPDHIHALMTLPEGDDDYPGRWQAIKVYFNRYLAAAGALEGEGRNVWQSRYWEHTVRDSRDFRAHADYIHFNPVKHGLVKQVVEWPFSSFHRFVRRGVLPQDWGGEELVWNGTFGE